MPKPAKDATLHTVVTPAAVITTDDVTATIKVSVIPSLSRSMTYGEKFDIEMQLAHHLRELFEKG